jgi:hypothetical protein
MEQTSYKFTIEPFDYGDFLQTRKELQQILSKDAFSIFDEFIDDTPLDKEITIWVVK